MVRETCAVVIVCHVVSPPWLCVTVNLQVLVVLPSRALSVVCLWKEAHAQWAPDPGTPRRHHHHHHTILQPASLPSAEISDTQSTLFATDVTGTLNFKIQLKCKVEKSQVASRALSLLSVNVVEMDLILVLFKGPKLINGSCFKIGNIMERQFHIYTVTLE